MSIYVKCSPTQGIYRQLLNAMSHPGRLYHLPVKGFWSKGWLAIADTLLDHEVSFAVAGKGASRMLFDRIVGSTTARPATIAEADYIFVPGADSKRAVLHCKRGTPEHPDRSATLIYLLEHQTQLPLDGVMLTGPGIPEPTSPLMGGLDRTELACIRSSNQEHPLGVDCMFLDEADHVMCIPRSTKIAIG